MTTRYEKLFSPGRIGTLELKNRLVMPPMGTRYADDQGHVGERTKKYYAERAKGGVGLIITEVTTVVPPVAQHLSVTEDGCLSGLAELAGVVHAAGAKIALQLWHSGDQQLDPQAPPEFVGPSLVKDAYGRVPRPLTISEIGDLVRRFAAGAVRAKKAGFDGVEIHGAHGYLIAQFLSAVFNRRDDEYGGSPEKRATFLLEIIRAIRTAVGRDFPVWCRLNGQEYIPGGYTVEDLKAMARLAEAAGADAIHVSGRGFTSHGSATIPQTPGLLAPLASAVKEEVSVPVIAVARLDHELGERLLREGKADFIAMGRRVIADPQIHRKVREGREAEITPCLGCNECIDFLWEHALWCAVNPAVGTADENRIQPAAKSKKVVVVGAGPAGMETALVAAARGHDVTLIEKSPTLGGQMELAAVPPHKGDLAAFLQWQVRQVEGSKVKVEVGRTATLEYLSELRPEAVVFATGGRPQRPPIAGLDEAKVVDAAAVLRGTGAVGETVVVIGGGQVGCETADHLAALGRKVTIVEMLDVIAAKMSPPARVRQLSFLAEAGVRVLTGARCEEIRDNILRVAIKGEMQTLAADTFVLATGYGPEDTLYREARTLFPETHLVGDAAEPRSIGDAMRDGLRVANAL